jgi:spermidine/putrescine transport system ATP-binding protein
VSTASISVELRDVTKRFGVLTAVEGVSLAVGRREFLTLLGPSGCGKTTTLRLIAGFERPTSGVVLIDGRAVQNLPAYKRPVNTVFQNYALFPHMTVFDNVAFGLRMKHVPAAERRRQVAAALDMVRLEGMERRKPGQLSGGQQQRVALARALVNRPSVLLLDEPLGALDLKLRRAMQLELRTLNREVGITFIYVTHDQEEALAMSDRIAVMSQGHVLQVGPAEEIYERPASRFVADFIGETNLLPVRILGVSGGIAAVALPCGATAGGRAGAAVAGTDATLAVRPERITIGSSDDATPSLKAGADDLARPSGRVAAGLDGTLTEAVYLGSATQYVVALPDGTRVTVRRPATASKAPLAPGASVRLSWSAADATVLTA